MRRRTHTVIAFAAIAITLVSCSSGAADTGTAPSTTLAPLTTLAPATTEATTTSTTGLPTTTTTIPPSVIGDTVNGLLAPDGVTNRRAVVIKIDNHPRARPQSGLMEADLMYEMLVEGGLTRFAAVFHQTDLEYVGPVRSGRPTDVGVVKALDSPFQISGAQWWVQDIFKREGLRMVYDTGETTWRIDSRSAPHNLFASSILLRGHADDRGWPDENPGNVFTFGVPTTPTAPATAVTLDWSDHPDVRWVWNGLSYERYNGDVPHQWIDEEGNGGTVTTPLIVVLIGKKTVSSPPDGNGSSVPTTNTVGTGGALVFIEGSVIEGTWDRESYRDPIHLATLDGLDLVLPPSKMWVTIFPHDRTISWE